MKEMVNKPPERCLCRWFRNGDRWVRDVPFSLCPVHFRNCPHCHGDGRVPVDKHTAELIAALEGDDGAP